MTDSDRIAALEARLAAAEGRIAVLEGRLTYAGPIPVVPLMPQTPAPQPPGWPWTQCTGSASDTGNGVPR